MKTETNLPTHELGSPIYSAKRLSFLALYQPRPEYELLDVKVDNRKFTYHNDNKNIIENTINGNECGVKLLFNNNCIKYSTE